MNDAYIMSVALDAQKAFEAAKPRFSKECKALALSDYETATALFAYGYAVGSGAVPADKERPSYKELRDSLTSCAFLLHNVLWSLREAEAHIPTQSGESSMFVNAKDAAFQYQDIAERASK